MNDLSLVLRTVTANEPKAMEWTLSVAPAQAKFAQMAFDHFATSLASVDNRQIFFQGIYVHARKMAGLSVLSALRQHRIESGQNLRQVIEATSLMGYHAIHPGTPEDLNQPDMSADDFMAANEEGLKRAFKWIGTAYPPLSRDLKYNKDHINRHLSHATVLGSAFVFDYAANTETDRGFFDHPDADETRMGLYLAGQVIMLALTMLGTAARDAQGIRLQSGFGAAYDDLVDVAMTVRKGFLG